MTFRTFLTNTAQREDGLTLIEVVITTLLVALIAVGTLTGFQTIDRASADERFHDEAVLLAAQSQEQLRSDPASTLDNLVGAANHARTYTTTIDKNIYTIKQEANYFNESKPGSDCLATGATESSAKNDGDYLRVTSSVTWPQLNATNRKAVTESSIVTPPDGSALEIDATNGANPEEALSGVSSIVKYTGVEASQLTTVEGTTGTAGCVVFGGIPATSAKVEIKELSGYVTESGAPKVPTKEVTIAPNITTHDPVVLNEGGAIAVNFTYGGKQVGGSTFVAAHEGAINANEFTVGAAKFEYESGVEKKYKTVTTESGQGYSTSATTPIASAYPTGDLFPFPYSSTIQKFKKKWQVYAGDCTENNAHAIDNSVANVEAIVLPGQTTPAVNVPMTDLVLNVYTGTVKTPEALTTKIYKIKITNTACSKSVAPNNASAANLEHTQETTATGHLKYPFQPFGKAKLCLANPTENRIYTVEPTLSEPVEHFDTIYLKESSKYNSPGSGDPVTVTTGTTC